MGGRILRKRLFLILLSFTCAFTVIILGNEINTYIKLKEGGKPFNIGGIVDKEKNKKLLNEYIDRDNLWILIDIDRKNLYLLDIKKNEVIRKYVVATGKPSTPTPTGTYKIVQKAKWGAGFGSRWMKINVPWGQYGIHGTNKPYSIGYDASHGCVRMRNKDVEELYSLVKYGTPVTLFRGQFGPFGHGYRVLVPGDRGEDVKEVQKRLKMKGYYYGALDGIYGESMKAALIRFLKDNKMPVTDRIGYNIYRKLGIILME